ncbi:MAG: C-terminal target protein [Ferruginibacter sp.]|nr:C-terminal target protein [Ferruginibacter sp.]
MKTNLHAVLCLLFFAVFFAPAQRLLAQGTSRVDIGKSFANMSKLSTGGTFNPGDTIEIRVTIAVIRQVTYTAVDSVQVFDIVPAKTTYIPGSMRVATNQGITYKGPFTETIDGDAGRNVGGNIIINLGKGANGTRGGRIRSDTSKPSFYNSHCIMMACYRVKVNASAAFGDTLFVGGSVKYKMVSPNNGWTTVTFPTYKILLFKNNGYCQNGTNISAASDSLGTFGTGSVQNRTAPLAFSTTYIKNNVGTNSPQDYFYAIVNNSSASGSTNVNGPMPESPATHRVFGLWDICGDHTGASNPSLGNPPAAPGSRKGYFVMVNASYNTDLAYQETLSNLCPNTYYEFSAWFRNLCPRCSCDSNGRGSSSAGFIPYPGNDSSGVRPNLTFEIDGLAYFTSGDIKYDRLKPWKQYGFTFLTKANQTTAKFTIRNNSPGGGGNDWAIDDIRVAHCGPSLLMNYNPYLLACKESKVIVNLSDTIRSIYNNSYIYFKWQRSNIGGTIWADMTGPGTSGVGAPTLVNGQYQYVTNLPPFIATYADSGRYYRVIVGTTAANLNSVSCSYNDGSATMLKIITCGVILEGNFTQFKAAIASNNAYLNWSSIGERKLSHYEIEKSIDGINFDKTASVVARNAGEAHYNFTDPEAITGARYYRLKMVDETGLFKYSQVVLLSKQLAFEIKSLQNPFGELINMELVVPADGKISTILFNDKGQKLLFNSQNVKKGLNKIVVDKVESLPAGVYYISVAFNNETIKRKLIRK